MLRTLYNSSGCQMESKHFLSILKTETVKSVLPSKYIRVKSFLCLMVQEDEVDVYGRGEGRGVI